MSIEDLSSKQQADVCIQPDILRMSSQFVPYDEEEETTKSFTYEQDDIYNDNGEIIPASLFGDLFDDFQQVLETLPNTTTTTTATSEVHSTWKSAAPQAIYRTPPSSPPQEAASPPSPSSPTLASPLYVPITHSPPPRPSDDKIIHKAALSPPIIRVTTNQKPSTASSNTSSATSSSSSSSSTPTTTPLKKGLFSFQLEPYDLGIDALHYWYSLDIL